MVKKQVKKAAQSPRRISSAMPISGLIEEDNKEKGTFQREKKSKSREQWPGSPSQAGK